MDEALLVRGVQRLGDLLQGADLVIARHGLLTCERGALDELHGDIRLTFNLADIVDFADMRVLDARLGPSFALELAALSGAKGVGLTAAQELDGHAAVEPTVARLIYRPHATSTEEAFDAIAIPRQVGQLVGAGARGG